MDGMVKIIIGLVLTIVSIGMVVLFTFAIQALVNERVVKWWALLMGVPGLVLAGAGIILMGMGSWKLLSGRGRG